MTGNEIKDLQEKIGYCFRDEKLLKQALTHSSYSNEMKTGHLGSNERLEFLGDAVLELVSSEFFFRNNPEMEEGELTRLRARFVCEQALDYDAREIGLGACLLLGKGEEATGGRIRPSIVSDAMEALIGAVYLDGGFAAAKDFVYGYVLNNLERKEVFFDSKTILQLKVQKEYRQEPEYISVGEEGPAHERIFIEDVAVNGKVLARGKGYSRKQAQQQAAFRALENI